MGPPSRRSHQVSAIDEPDHVLRRARFGTGRRASRDEQLYLGKGQREIPCLVHAHIDQRDTYVRAPRGTGQERFELLARILDIQSREVHS